MVSALRTPITRAKKGGLKDTPADDLVATLLKATVDRTGLDVNDVGDVVVGSVLGNSSQRANECRIAMFLAGFPQEVPVRTVNRQCSSGLQACADVAAAIKAGYYDVGIAAGVETMTSNPMKWEGGMNPRVASSSDAQSCLIPMGVTSENVAERWCVYFYFRRRYGQLVMMNFSCFVHSQENHARAAGHPRGAIARQGRRRATRRTLRLADRPGSNAVEGPEDGRGVQDRRGQGRRDSRGDDDDDTRQVTRGFQKR